MIEADPSLLDTMILENGSNRRQDQQARPRKGIGSLSERVPLRDSLISGPMEGDTVVSEWDTSAIAADSARATGSSRRKRKPTQLKRYEQRIFRSFDRSAFANGSGAAGRDYVLGPGDAVILSIWGDKEREYNLTLNQDGKAFVEGIGLVELAGRTLEGAAEALRQRLGRIYSGINRGSTHVETSLGKAGPIRVFVLGEVKVPGGYVFTGQTGVMTALYYAKGPTDLGTVRNIQLTRSGKTFTLDLYQYLILGRSLSPHSLQDGDILFAGRANALVDIGGEVGRPATYELAPGEGVKELIAFANGLNPNAATHRVTLHRVFANGKTDVLDLPPPQDFISGKAKVELRDGDKVIIEKSAEASDNFFSITGPVKYPGTYEATGIRSVDQLIAKAGGLRADAYLGRVHVVRFRPDGSSSLLSYSMDSTIADSISLLPKDNIILYSLKEMYLPDSVQISGAVFKPGKYEFRQGMTAKDLVMQAGGYLPHHENGRLLVFRGNDRDRRIEQVQLQVKDGLSKSETGFQLTRNDLVQVPIDPNWYQKEIVTIEGLVVHPGKYSLLHPGEQLSSLVERAGGFKPNAYAQGGRFFRVKDSVGRVGIDIQAAVRKPNGKANIGLVGGDSIFIPERLNTVKVIGEVGFETSVLYQDGAGVQYYIEKAGGFTRRSEKEHVVVQYANGETGRDGYFNRTPDAGSVIYVPKGPEPKPIDWFAGLNALLGTAGLGVALILSIQAFSK